MTNLEKYNSYKLIIDKTCDDFCTSLFPNGLPIYFYDISVNFNKHESGYYIRTAKTERLNYSLDGDIKMPFFNKRPSNKDVNRIKLISEWLSVEIMDRANVFIFMKNGSTSWATRITEIDKKNLSANKNDMKAILKEKIKHYNANYLVNDGQFSCTYCRKATDNDKKVVKNVISRQYNNYKKSFDYCSDECASRNQMAHEG